MKLAQPIDASQSYAYFDTPPTGDPGYLVISPNSEKEEVVCWTSNVDNRVQFAVSPAARTNSDGFGRGLEGTMAQDHDTNEPIEEYNPDAEDLTIHYKGITINLSPKVKLSLPSKPTIRGLSSGPDNVN